MVEKTSNNAAAGSADPMSQAIAEAKEAARNGEVPVGAVVFHRPTQKILSIASNLVETNIDATAHAELLAIREASKLLASPRLIDCDLYVTLEPCTMCASAISHARIARVYFGAYDPKGGGVEHGARFYQQPTCHHQPEVIGGMREEECASLLKSFFSERRD
ncbi:MAG: nucleoside deaminase [Alphaproteobacteria bacterium]|nr:nucleoside deaminase [Alphaproteobacteria bacterium]